MYYLTGLPGWMRFGFSPGWVGRSPTGLGPCAQFLMSGQWPTPQMQTAWQGMQAGQPTAMPFAGPAWGGMPVAGAAPDRETQINFLRSQAEMLRQQLEQVQARVAELEKQP